VGLNLNLSNDVYGTKCVRLTYCRYNTDGEKNQAAVTSVVVTGIVNTFSDAAYKLA